MSNSGMPEVCSSRGESSDFDQFFGLFKQLSLTTVDAKRAMTARLQIAQLTSIFMIAQYEEDRFLIIYGAALEGWARDIYGAARRLVAQHEHQSLLDTIHRRHAASPEIAARALAGSTPVALSFQSLFKESGESLCAPGQIEAWDSPAAYLVSLYRKVRQFETLAPSPAPLKLAELSLTKRRTDLLGIELSDDQLHTSIQALALINPLLEKSVICHSSLADEAALYKKLATTYYPLSLPFHLPYVQIKRALEEKHTSPGEVFAHVQDLLSELSPFTPYSSEYMREYLACSPSEYALWFARSSESTNFIDPRLMPVKGAVALTVFCTATGLSKLNVEELICSDAFSSLNAEGAAVLGGAHYITGTETAVQLEKGADGQDFLRCTQPQVLRMLQMIRLQRLVDVPFSQLDGLIEACKNSKNARGMPLNVLGLFGYLNRQYAVSVEILTVLLSSSMPVVGTLASPSLFDRVFNQPGKFAQPLDFNQLPASAEQLTNCAETTRRQLCAGMGVNAATLDLLAATLDANGDNSSPSGLGYCSTLYSFTALSRLFRLKPQELLLLGDWLGIKLLAHSSTCEQTMDNIRRLNAVVVWLRQQSLTVAALQPILSTEIAVLDSDEPVTQLLEQLATLAVQFPDPPALDNAVIQAVAQYCAVPPEQAVYLLTAVGQTTNKLVTLGQRFMTAASDKQQPAIDCATIFTYDLVRYASALAFSGLSTAGIEAWMNNPQWFGCTDTKLSLSALYAMRQYALLLNAASVTEAQLLNYLKMANSAQGCDLLTAAQLFSIKLDVFYSKAAQLPTTSLQLSALIKLQTFAETTELPIKTLVDLYTLLLRSNANVEGGYAKWQQVAEPITLSVYQRPD
ncbi:Tc toxin subunit A [Pseudomonas sp. NPDC079086]|uniref:Tc toxin subunit A n=1 Tax=unclassified Pseudomonas TaxID=196821 RepID=UPI0037C844D0